MARSSSKGKYFIKTRRRNKTKPKAPVRRAYDPLAHNGMVSYMEAYFEWMKVLAYSPDTIRAARSAIRRFIGWCDERSLNTPTDITKQVLERYQRHLFYYRKPDGRPLTLGSQMAGLAPLKMWFRWLSRQNHILYNPASEIDLPRTGKRLPRVILSHPEVESVLAEAVTDSPQGLRDRALLELLYSTALRRMEAANLAVYDLDFDRRLVLVREGKGRKDRVVPVGARALAWLDKYVLEARPQLLAFDHPALFVTDYGEPVTRDFVADRVRKYLNHAGIHKPGAAHLLRHACATHMLEGGAEVRFIQAMLGHESLETTQIYTHVAIDKLKAIHEATHPARLHRPEPAAAEAGGEAAPPPPEAREALLSALEAETDA